jgi:hypothetical protein
VSDRDRAFYRRPVWLLTGFGWLPAWADDGLRDFVILQGVYERYVGVGSALGYGGARPRDPNRADGGDRP